MITWYTYRVCCSDWLKVIEKWKPYVFIFLIEALGPISCKNLNKLKKMSQKPISRNQFWTEALCIFHTSRIRRPIVVTERLIMFLDAIFKVCKISKTKRRYTYSTGLVVKLFFDATLLMTDIIRKSSITDRVTNLATLSHQISRKKNDLVANMPKIFLQYWSSLRTSGVIFRFQNRNLYTSQWL